VECGCAGEKQHEKIFSLVFFISKILKNKSVNSSLPKDKKVLAGAGIPMNLFGGVQFRNGKNFL